MIGDIKKFETLYKLIKPGKIRKWDICVECKKHCSYIYFSYGSINKKKVYCERRLDDYFKAVSYAQSMWKEKKKCGYSADYKRLIQ